MFGLDFIEENDSLLFTYCGVGKFRIILFDNGKVEKYIDTIANVPGIRFIFLSLHPAIFTIYLIIFIHLLVTIDVHMRYAFLTNF